jgi:hypothetical protein
VQGCLLFDLLGERGHYTNVSREVTFAQARVPRPALGGKAQHDDERRVD